MLRKIVGGAALAAILFSTGAPAMAAEWRYVRSSHDRSALQTECDNGIRFGSWNECNIHEDNGFHLFVR